MEAQEPCGASFDLFDRPIMRVVTFREALLSRHARYAQQQNFDTRRLVLAPIGHRWQFPPHIRDCFIPSSILRTSILRRCPAVPSAKLPARFRRSLDNPSSPFKSFPSIHPSGREDRKVRDGKTRRCTPARRLRLLLGCPILRFSAARVCLAEEGQSAFSPHLVVTHRDCAGCLSCCALIWPRSTMSG
jgi:hypothetical protein